MLPNFFSVLEINVCRMHLGYTRHFNLSGMPFFLAGKHQKTSKTSKNYHSEAVLDHKKSFFVIHNKTQSCGTCQAAHFAICLVKISPLLTEIRPKNGDREYIFAFLGYKEVYFGIHNVYKT